MKNQTFLCVAVVLILGSAIGCRSKSEETADKLTSESTANAAAETEDKGTGVTVSVASWQDVQDVVASHQGKVVVIDLWSTWCVPCMREFPNLVELQNRFPDHVACISLNLNYDGSADKPPESHREKVLEFLTKRKASFQNFICSDADENMYTNLDLGSIPAIYVYDTDGTLHKRFDNDSGEYGDEGFTYQDHVVPLVEELLKS
jgi:thiol-disulfide isomerase/thioredoxin